MPPIKRLEIYNKIMEFKFSSSGRGGSRNGSGAGGGSIKGAAAPSEKSTSGKMAAENFDSDKVSPGRIPSVQRQKDVQIQQQQLHQGRNLSQQQHNDEDSAHSSNNSLDTSSE